MAKAICFDMDGTIANLYEVEDWQEMLDNGSSLPYLMADPLYDMVELVNAIKDLQAAGWYIEVITWGSRTANKCQLEEIRQAKLEWLQAYEFPFDGFHCVKYGTTKAKTVVKYETGILIDDNEKIRKGWKLGNTLNPSENLIEELKKLLQIISIG